MSELEVNLGFDTVPDNHTCEGSNISPRIEIRGLNAPSLAVIVEDPDAPSGTFTHWLAWNMPPVEVIPSGIPNKAEVSAPIPSAQGRNSFGEIGYSGPCPPPGKQHRYVFRVFGLDSPLGLPGGATRHDMERAMKGHILQRGVAVATYSR